MNINKEGRRWELIGVALGALLLLGCTDQPANTVQPVAGQSPEYGQLAGTVTGSQPGVLPVVYAYNS